MTVKEARDLLCKAVVTDKACNVNPTFTHKEFIQIINEGLDSYAESSGEDFVLSDIFEKRVYQAARNQRRPRY